jgi:hypothetical protein
MKSVVVATEMAAQSCLLPFYASLPVAAVADA